MNFPLVPLPGFVTETWPFLAGVHIAAAILFAFFFGFVALLELGGVEIGGYYGRQSAIKFFASLGIAVAFLAFGIYLTAIMVVLIIIYLIGLIVKAISLIFGRS